MRLVTASHMQGSWVLDLATDVPDNSGFCLFPHVLSGVGCWAGC